MVKLFINHIISHFRQVHLNRRYSNVFVSQKCSIFNCSQVTQNQTHPHSVNRFTVRTHTCGQLTKQDIGKRVSLYGWVQYTRFSNKIIVLRDSYGVTQCIVDKPQLSEHFRHLSIYNESIVQISGTVRARPAGQENRTLPTGDVEIISDQVNVLNYAKKDLPILTRDSVSSSQTNSLNRLKYRYLDIRSSEMQEAIRLRSKVCHILRTKLHELNFVECETPTLYNRTPGGANEFIVPTRLPGKFYSLVQSPQQLKQMLMIGGLDRYFQICRCYRDEANRPDRQPEFTQVDIEMSFTEQDLVMKLIDELLLDLLKSMHNSAELTASFDDNSAIKRMTFHDAFESYGTDKPDTRFGWKIVADKQCNGLSITIPSLLSENEVLELIEEVKSSLPHIEPTEIYLEHCNTTNQMIIRSSNQTESARKLLGRLRITIASELQEQGQDIYESRFEFLWVTDFPLFTVDEHGNLESNHHPFTAPTDDTIHLLDVNPTIVTGQHYDLVLNGQEVAGGSIRIHDPKLQKHIFTELLKVDDNEFDYFIEALNSGCPPHGGIAIGLDRLMATLLSKESIRDVMAFPKASSGRDLLTDCPQELSVDVKRLYHIS